MTASNSERARVVSRSIPRELIPSFLQHILRPKLPYSLPLYRRCQFNYGQTVASPNAEVWIAFTTNDESEDADHVSGDTRNRPAEDFEHLQEGPWTAAHIDVTTSGQTQVWVFASWEPELSLSDSPAKTTLESPLLPTHRNLFRRLYKHLRDEHIVHLSQEPSDEWQRLRDTGKIISLPYSRSKILFGTVAECLHPFLEDLNGTDDDKNKSNNITREDRGYLKYIVPNPASIATAPAGLHFGQMQVQHLQLVLDRTVIPRTIETVRQLLSIGLFDKNETPVAWGLVGKDASISSLHTEPEYRGQGIAEIVSRELCRRQKEVFSPPYKNGEQDITDYAAADVSQDNKASRRVMEKLGGKVMWKVGWIEVDLDQLN